MMVTQEDLYNYPHWRQRIRFEDNKITPGTHSLRWEALGLPEDLSGKSFLEVGAYDGMYSFEAERRGAETVLATDIWDTDEIDGSEYPNTPDKTGFDLAHEYLDSSVSSERRDILELHPGNIGTYDITLCMSVVSWTNYPLWSLKRLASVTDDTLVLTLALSGSHNQFPEIKMYGNESSAYQQRWLMNKSTVRHVLRNTLGFSDVTIQKRESNVHVHPYVQLQSPVVVYEDYQLAEKKTTLDAGVKLKTRTEQDGTVCIADWRPSDDGLTKFGWVAADELSFTEEVETIPNLRTIQSYLSSIRNDNVGFREIVNELGSVSRILSDNKNQQAYIVQAIK
ncbi:hypothetical protein [Halovenus salina]|uniref:Methyltransferase domain-containing protein n=1 Tax=Halovenus salina TaxID=1510225 RepID=A0ABD5VX00_9EURY|nr:hypothetical protein [Halovenus salina]